MQVYLELEEEEAEFIAGELHRLINIDIDKEKKQKAVRIGNKIAEQLSEQRNLKEETRGKSKEW